MKGFIPWLVVGAVVPWLGATLLPPREKKFRIHHTDVIGFVRIDR